MMSLLALLSVPPAVRAQDHADDVVGRAARVYRSLTSLRADFKQVIDDEAVGTFESRGVMVQAGQNKLTMRFSDPKGDAIVLDGKFVWVYTPSTTPGQVLRMPIPTGPVYGFNVLAWLLDKPTERYRSKYLKRDFVDFVQTDVVELVPLADDLPFRKATLWLDRDTALPRISRLRHVPSSSGRNIRPAASAGIPAASASRSARADNATV